MHSVERAFKELAVSHPADDDDDRHLAEVPKKKLLFSPEAAAIKTPPMSIGSSRAGSTYRAAPPPYKGEYNVAGSSPCAPIRPREPQPKRVVKDAIF